MRVMGIDHGQQRIGVAISDPTRTLARPLLVLERKSKRRSDLAALVSLARENEATEFVVGIPFEMTGHQGKKANEVIQFAEALAELGGIPVHHWDERLSTVAAHDLLRETGAKKKRRAQAVDSLAASYILQGWLDARPASGSNDG